MKTLGPLVLLLCLLGCGSPDPSAEKLSQELKAGSKETASKLQSMSPAEQKAYLEQHPEAANELIGQPRD